MDDTDDDDGVMARRAYDNNYCLFGRKHRALRAGGAYVRFVFAYKWACGQRGVRLSVNDLFILHSEKSHI